MYDARFITNHIIMSFPAEAHRIDLKKINFLIYLIDGFHIASHGKRILNNHIEAFPNGPGIRVICEEFRRFREKPIKALATYYDYESMGRVIADPDKMCEESRKFVFDVASSWVRLDILEVEQIVCMRGGPWWRTYYHGYNNPLLTLRIPEREIEEYFTTNFIEPVPQRHVH